MTESVVVEAALVVPFAVDPASRVEEVADVAAASASFCPVAACSCSCAFPASSSCLKATMGIETLKLYPYDLQVVVTGWECPRPRLPRSEGGRRSLRVKASGLSRWRAGATSTCGLLMGGCRW